MEINFNFILELVPLVCCFSHKCIGKMVVVWNDLVMVKIQAVAVDIFIKFAKSHENLIRFKSERVKIYKIIRFSRNELWDDFRGMSEDNYKHLLKYMILNYKMLICLIAFIISTIFCHSLQRVFFYIF